MFSSLAKNFIWNVFLAVIPVMAAYYIVRVARLSIPKPARYLALVPLSALWLVFLPNTCYLLTEWRHFLEIVDGNNLFLRSGTDKSAFVLMLSLGLYYFMYSGLGMFLFTLAIRPIEHLAAKRGASVTFWALPFFIALSLGVYLGLILRFNSWDLATRPAIIWYSIVEIGGRPALTTFIACFGVFLWLAYQSIDIWIDGLTERLSKKTGRRIHLGPRVD